MDRNINKKNRSVCDGLLRGYQIRDEAIANLTRLVKEAVDRPAPHRLHRDTTAPHAVVPPDLNDADGNLRAADIGITWQGSETFLHGVKVVGPLLHSQPAMLMPYMPCRCGNMPPVTCHRRRQFSHRVWRFQIDMYTGQHTTIVRAIERFNMLMAGIRTSVPYNWCHTWTRPR